VKAASAYDGSPPADQQSSSETSFVNGRRQTWPLGTTVVPAVRRRQPQSADCYGEEDLDKVAQSAILQSAAADAAASPISRLIQRYEHHVMASSAPATEALAPHRAPSGGREDWFQLQWQPSITSATSAAANDNSCSNTDSSASVLDHGDGVKTYSCHICSYIG